MEITRRQSERSTPQHIDHEAEETLALPSEEVPLTPTRRSASATPAKSTPSQRFLSPRKRRSASCGRTPPSKRRRQPFLVTSTSPGPAEDGATREPFLVTRTSPKPAEDGPTHGRTSSKNLKLTPRTRRAAEALCKLQETRRDKSTQTPIVKTTVKSVSVSCKPSVRTRSSQTVEIGLVHKQSPEFKNVAISPMKLPKVLPKIPKEGSLDSTDEASSGMSQGSSTCTEPLNTTGSSFSEEHEDKTSNDLQKLNVQLCFQDSMYFLGIPQCHSGLVKVISDCTQADIVGVMVTLKKIRLNPTFKELGYDFSVSESFCSKAFQNLVPKLSQCGSKLILWPPKDDIKRHLPITFRARYSNVQSVIDCLEIEIEKPSDPILQTLTWSQYKKCNTIKYLISSTPDGYINFISKGYGGRISDVKITEECGYLDVLPNHCAVMADRGFKGVAPLLAQKHCQLIHPPSVSADQKKKKPSKQEVALGRRIAGLRIHIERVIRRLREFSFLKPHACVRHELVKYLDHIVIIACGLVNLQKPVIKRYV